MTPTYIAKLVLVTQKTNVGAQKIDGLLSAIYGIVLAGSLVQERLGKIQFFVETCLLANISMGVLLRMFFLTLSNTDVQFVEKKLE